LIKKQFYRPDEVAEILAVSTRMVYKLIHQKKLAAVKIGKVFRVPADVIDTASRGDTTAT